MKGFKILIEEDTGNEYYIIHDSFDGWEKYEKELAKERIIFNGGCYAVKLKKDNASKYIFLLGIEDDGILRFNDYQNQSISFSSELIYEIIDRLLMAFDMLPKKERVKMKDGKKLQYLSRILKKYKEKDCNL